MPWSVRENGLTQQAGVTCWTKGAEVTGRDKLAGVFSRLSGPEKLGGMNQLLYPESTHEWWGAMGTRRDRRPSGVRPQCGERDRDLDRSYEGQRGEFYPFPS